MTDEEQDQSEEIQRSIDCMFADLDVDGDGKLVRSTALPWQLFFNLVAKQDLYL